MLDQAGFERKPCYALGGPGPGPYQSAGASQEGARQTWSQHSPVCPPCASPPLVGSRPDHVCFVHAAASRPTSTTGSPSSSPYPTASSAPPYRATTSSRPTSSYSSSQRRLLEAISKRLRSCSTDARRAPVPHLTPRVYLYAARKASRGLSRRSNGSPPTRPFHHSLREAAADRARVSRERSQETSQGTTSSRSQGRLSAPVSGPPHDLASTCAPPPQKTPSTCSSSAQRARVPPRVAHRSPPRASPARKASARRAPSIRRPRALRS